MAPLLRRKLLCFYCGCRSAQTRTPNIRRWDCEKCKATNYLDENGDITDPPPSDTTSEVRYAQSIPRPASPQFTSAEKTIFCSTCLKNQHLLTESLATYLPSPHVPNYSVYEDAFPEYRKNLEERYPPVCENCESRVRERLRLTNYAAKTDHLRRVMQRTRGTVFAPSGWSWNRLGVAVGGTAWLSAGIAPVLWNFMGALKVMEEPHGLRDVDPSSSMSSCLWQSWQNKETKSDCARLYHPVASLSLILGILSIWWNPKLAKRTEGKGGRLVGLKEYYKLQVMFLAIRLAAWAVLGETTSIQVDPQTAKATHYFMLVFTVVAIIVSFRTVQIDYTPRFSFKESPEPLISRRPQEDSYLTERTPSRPQRGTHTAHLNSHTLSFPISKLAPPPPQPYPPPRNQITPPPDEEEDSAMEWTPTQASFRTPATYQPRIPLTLQPSHQTPSKPQAHLRNPRQQPRYGAQPTSPQDNPFTPTPTIREAMQTFYRSSTTPAHISTPITTLPSPTIAPARFFPTFATDTGLESLFKTTFSLRDEPPEVLNAHQQQQQQQQQFPQPHVPTNPASPKPPSYRPLYLLLLLFSTTTYTLSPPNSLPLHLLPLTTAATITSLHLLQTLQRQPLALSDILLFTTEFCTALIICNAVRTGPSLEPAVQALGAWFLGVLGLQEGWIWVGEWRGTAATAAASGVVGEPTRSQTVDYGTSANDKVALPRPSSALALVAPEPVPVVRSSREGRSGGMRRIERAPGKGFGGLSLE